ncbi:hypothetical protein M0805_009688 [Coniferiporia weirii]|nr:hypothetical protein M0805_009688 [Coniferiporia weirii]
MATLTQTTARIARPAPGPSAHLALQLQSPPQSLQQQQLQSAPLDEQGAFAFVRIYGEVCLVQTDAPLSCPSPSPSPKSPLFPTPAPTAVAIAVFRHEFGTMFRYARRATLPTRDVQVLAALDAAGVLCEGASGVVFLSREMTDQLLRWTAPASPRLRRRF